MIYEAMNSVIISADRAATVWENKDRQVKKRMIRQQDHINYHLKKVNIIDVDLILQTTRESMMTHKHIKIRVFMLRDFSHHVN